MIRIFYRQGDKILKDNDVKRLDLLTNIMWVDMQAPTSEEEEWIESKSKISIQTPQEITEIESSSRYFERNNEITANSNFLRLENGQYEKHAVSFIIKDSILYTFRQADLSTFADVVRKMKLSKLRAFVSVQNFFLATKFPGYDPEVANTGAAFDQGFDLYQYPKARTFMIGLNIGL